MSPCPVYIDGEWSTPANGASTPVFNPSVGEVIANVPMGGAELVDAAVRSAAEAFPGWWETPPIERCRVLFRYKAILEDHFDELLKSISREHGKTQAEARGDMRRGIEMVEFACGIPSMLMGSTLENVARSIDCEAIRQPLGVCAGITPFNFPAMVPLWMFPIAIACGNTFVLKPSEKVPLTAIRLIELLQEAGLPKGVLNLIHGGRDCSEALLAHPDVKAISFVGSTPAARNIYQTGARYGKRVQAAGGAKNFVVIMPDADLGESVRGLTEGAFGCAGERCMAGSTAVAVGDAAKTLLPPLVEAARALKVGPTDRASDAQMGPVITAQHRDRILELVERGVKEGARVAQDGRGVRVDGAPGGFYLGATVLDGVDPSMTVMKEEIFGPVLNVIHAPTLEAAVELANANCYGNGASIFTSSGRSAREFKHRAKAGMVGINISVPAPMAFFPFTGWGDSFFGDLHIQGQEGVQFFTRQKVTTTRWFSPGEGDIWHKNI